MLLNDVNMTSLSNTQSTVDMAIEQWRGRLRACVCAKRGHFEQPLNLLTVLILSTIYHFCIGTVENHENTEAVFSVFFVSCRVFRVF